MRSVTPLTGREIDRASRSTIKMEMASTARVDEITISMAPLI